MEDGNTAFETSTRRPRFNDKGESISRFAAPQQTNTKSPSQKLRDLFFAAYTTGGAEKSSRKRNFTSAALQTPTKKSTTSVHDMDVDSATVSPFAKRAKENDMEIEEEKNSGISEEDLKGPVVPLAINNTTGRFYSEHMRRCELRIELMGLNTLGHNPRGIYVMPSLSSINVWYGVMFVRRGYWRDAVIRFRIDIPREYPKTHPIITLITSVSHPLVRLEDGRFALEQQFPQWTPYSDYIFHALHYLKNAFKNRVLGQLQPRDCYNIGAYMKFRNDLPQFREHARVDAMKSRTPESLYKPQAGDCPIVFSSLSDQQFESTMKQMKAFTQQS